MPARPSGRGTLRKGKSLGNKNGEWLGSGLCYEGRFWADFIEYDRHFDVCVERAA